MSVEDQLRPPALPKGLAVLVSLLCGLVAISAMGGLAAALLNKPPSWFFLGFEIVTLVAGCFGVAVGLGRASAGPALALVCVSGAIGASGFLGYHGSGSVVMGMNLWPLALARIGVAALLAVIAGVAVILRRPRLSVPKLLGGLGCAAALVVIGLGAWRGWGILSGVSVPVQAILGVVLSAVLLGLLAAAVQLTIQGFETGSIEPDGKGS